MCVSEYNTVCSIVCSIRDLSDLARTSRAYMYMRACYCTLRELLRFFLPHNTRAYHVIIYDRSNFFLLLLTAAVMCKFRHPNIIKLYGVVSHMDLAYIVMELAPHGQVCWYI